MWVSVILKVHIIFNLVGFCGFRVFGESPLLSGVDYLQIVKKVRWVLTAEGKNYTSGGSPEVQVFEAVPADGGIAQADLKAKLDALVYDVGFKTAMKNKWIQTTKGSISRKVCCCLWGC